MRGVCPWISKAPQSLDALSRFDGRKEYKGDVN
jgi:hypothetical protein